MQQLIIHKDISEIKMKALLYFLKSWDIEAVIKTNTKISSKNKSDFTLSAGLWKDYSIDAKELRKQAWNKNV